MSFIGLLDVDGLELAFAPYAFKRGDGKASFNTGNFPTYPNGAFQNCSLENMGNGYGYVNSGILKGDAVDDYIQTEYNPTVSDASDWTIEIKCNLIDNASLQAFISQAASPGDVWYIGLYNDGGGNQMYFWFEKAAAQRFAVSNDRFLPGYHYFVYRKTGGLLELFHAGNQIASYLVQQTYDIGTLSIVRKACIFGCGVMTVHSPSEIYWLGLYSKALSDATILTNANLDKAMGGLYGVSEGSDTMDLVYQNPNPRHELIMRNMWTPAELKGDERFL